MGPLFLAEHRLPHDCFFFFFFPSFAQVEIRFLAQAVFSGSRKKIEGGLFFFGGMGDGCVMEYNGERRGRQGKGGRKSALLKLVVVGTLFCLHIRVTRNFVWFFCFFFCFLKKKKLSFIEYTKEINEILCQWICFKYNAACRNAGSRSCCQHWRNLLYICMTKVNTWMKF